MAERGARCLEMIFCLSSVRAEIARLKLTFRTTRPGEVEATTDGIGDVVGH